MLLKYDRKAVKSWAKSRIHFFHERRLAVLFILIGLVLLFLFWQIVEMLFVMAMFIALGIGSMMYNRWVKVSLGFELIMLGVVITGMLYGRFHALTVGFIALFFAEVLSNRFTHSTFVSFIGMFAIAMVVPFFADNNVKWVGIGMTLLYDIIILPGYILLGSSPGRSLLFFSTHVIFNSWIFITIAPLIMSLLS